MGGGLSYVFNEDDYFKKCSPEISKRMMDLKIAEIREKGKGSKYRILSVKEEHDQIIYQINLYHYRIGDRNTISELEQLELVARKNKDNILAKKIRKEILIKKILAILPIKLQKFINGSLNKEQVDKRKQKLVSLDSLDDNRVVEKSTEKPTNVKTDNKRIKRKSPRKPKEKDVMDRK